MPVKREPHEIVRTVEVKQEARRLARAILRDAYLLPGSSESETREDTDRVTKLAEEIEPLLAKVWNLEENYDELKRKLDVAMLSHRQGHKWTRLALGITLFAAIVGLEVKDQVDDHAIVAELRRQVGNADATSVGGQIVYEFDKQGQPLLTKNAKGQAVYKTHFVPKTAWEMIEKLHERVGQLEGYTVDTRDGWSGDTTNSHFVLDNAEVAVLAADSTHDLLRVLLEQDMDGDGFTNRDDACVDMPGVNWASLEDVTFNSIEEFTDQNVTDAINEFDGCPDPRVDTDHDYIADYRDQCIEAWAEGESESYDPYVLHGARSIFPADQGCSLSQVRRRCTSKMYLDETAGSVSFSGCPGGHRYVCTWNKDSQRYQDCVEEDK